MQARCLWPDVWCQTFGSWQFLMLQTDITRLVVTNERKKKVFVTCQLKMSFNKIFSSPCYDYFFLSYSESTFTSLNDIPSLGILLLSSSHETLFMLKIFLGHNAIILLFLKLKSIRLITDAIGLLVPCWMYSAFLQRQPCLSGAFLHSLLQWARLITDCCLWTEAPFISFFSTSFPPFHTALSTD